MFASLGAPAFLWRCFRDDDFAASLRSAQTKRVLRNAGKGLDAAGFKRAADLAVGNGRIDDELGLVVAVELGSCLRQRDMAEDKFASPPSQRVGQLMCRYIRN